MPTIRVIGSRFAAPLVALNGSALLSFTWAEVIWAAITVGKAESAHLLRYGVHSSFELLYRVAIIYANWREDNSGRLCRTKAFKALDPSEKGAMSYFFALTVAKLVAERYLNTPWLMHLDVYRDRLSPLILVRGKVRPDLIGRDSSNRWIVIEAKGRSGVLPASVIRTAKAQTLKLVSVSGQAVALRVALAAHFDGDRLGATLEDPEGSIRGASLELTVEQFHATYYGPILALLNYRARASPPLDSPPGLHAVEIPELDLSVDVQQPNAEAIGDRHQPQHSHDALSYVGHDGVAVQLGPSWSSDLMQREPPDRAGIREPRVT